MFPALIIHSEYIIDLETAALFFVFLPGSNEGERTVTFPKWEYFMTPNLPSMTIRLFPLVTNLFVIILNLPKGTRNQGYDGVTFR